MSAADTIFAERSFEALDLAIQQTLKMTPDGKSVTEETLRAFTEASKDFIKAAKANGDMVDLVIQYKKTGDPEIPYDKKPAAADLRSQLQGELREYIAQEILKSPAYDALPDKWRSVPENNSSYTHTKVDALNYFTLCIIRNYSINLMDQNIKPRPAAPRSIA